MLSILLPQEFVRNAGTSVHISVCLIKIDCSLYNIKPMTFLDNNISTEWTIEKCKDSPLVDV